MSAKPYLVWLRDDLRLEDHAAIAKAAQRGPVLPVYVWEESLDRTAGAASRWWLHHSLQRLAATIRKQGGRLFICRGDTATELN